MNDKVMLTPEEMRGSHIRVSAIWCIPALGLAPLPDELKEALEDADERLPSEISWLGEAIEEIGEDEAFEEFPYECAARGLDGFLLVADCPVFSPSGSCGASYSWGYYRAHIFYAPDLETGIRAAVEWGDQQYAAAIAKAQGATQ